MSSRTVTLARLRPLLALLVALAVGQAPERTDVEQETKLKAGFTLNFTKHVTWPGPRFQDKRSPWVVGVVGNHPVTSVLQALGREMKTSGGRAFEVRSLKLTDGKLPDTAALAACHIVFLPAAEKDLARDLVRAVRGRSVLTVSDAKDFAVRRGVVEFVVVGGKLRFRINRDALRRAGLTASPRFLQYALDMEQPEDPPPPKEDDR